jgi:hypothetical protein
MPVDRGDSPTGPASCEVNDGRIGLRGSNGPDEPSNLIVGLLDFMMARGSWVSYGDTQRLPPGTRDYDQGPSVASKTARLRVLQISRAYVESF